MELKAKFNHLDTQKGKYNKWLEKEVFKADMQSDKQPYSIILPPPNVTGKLHLGHAWDGTLQDILIRYKKMQGFETMWIPGMDHAGIATQAKVDEKLRAQGTSRFDIGRTEFMKVAWEWKEEYAQIIRDQWAMMGFALDYSQEKFTLDSDVNKSVNKVFVELYNQGLIYQGNRITNWDPAAMTALSDIEVIRKDVSGKFYYLKYMLENSDEFLTVATTRPETCFADVAVIVHPEDEKFAKYIGQNLIVPGTDRIVPIIADDYVDMSFGTGCMKVTPAHDVNDFEIGKRHNLEMPVCMNLDGTMNEMTNEFNGLDRFVCREAYINKLTEMDLVVKIDDHEQNIGHSERTGVVVEPILSKQWYVKMDALAKRAIENQQSEEKIDFFPERFEGTFLSWMENIQDWCISRQLWWGHQIPVYIHNETKEMVVSIEPPIDIENYTQDEDVLDTWFSSALWPFSTTIWADKDEEIAKFFPTNVLVTGYDIIFFWVSRMIFQSLHFTDQNPFEDVLIHGLIRGEDGRKMSKSLGNGIDPMDVIESHGTDALRLFLTSNSAPGQDLRYSTEKMDSTWNFINKVWNVSRFVLMNTDNVDHTTELNVNTMDSADHYLINRLNETITTVSTFMDKYEFSIASTELYNFIWEDFANWYVEVSKSYLLGDNVDKKVNRQVVLKTVLEDIIKMLHPFTPFVTDEIYTQFSNVDSVMLTTWPQVIDNVVDQVQVVKFEKIKEIIVGLRNMRAENDIKPSLPLDVVIETELTFNEDDINILKTIAKINDIAFTLDQEVEVITFVTSVCVVNVINNGIIDNDAKIAGLNEQATKLENEITRSVGMLSNQNFVSRAPQDKINTEVDKGLGYIKQYEDVCEVLSKLGVNSLNQQLIDDAKKVLEEVK